MEKLAAIKTWFLNRETSSIGAKELQKTKTGYKALFYGDDTPKVSAAVEALGKELNKEIFRVDLAQVVSKYIGETEKNLSAIFTRAENKDWILFFDEADALFGKRTDIKDSHDRYANQEAAYLMQLIDNYRGLAILATNTRSNIDPAFLRRFQSVIEFPKPKVAGK